MKQSILLIFFHLICINANCQHLNICGEFPAHQASTTNIDSIYYDRFGNTYDKHTLQSTSGTTSCQAGYFDLRFSNVPIEYHDVICNVFQDVSNLLAKKMNNYGCVPPEIVPDNQLVNIEVKMVTSNAFGASASAFYVLDNYKCNYALNPSEIYSVINGGRDHGLSVHGRLFISDFWNWNFSYSTIPNSSELDFRSVILHEALHLCGFSPLTSSSGRPLATLNHFDYYDHYLYTDYPNAPNLEKIITSNGLVNCWLLNSNFTGGQFNNIVADNCMPNSNSLIGFGSPMIAVASTVEDYTIHNLPQPSILAQLAHLSVLCNTNGTELIMQPTIDFGIRRIIVTPVEKEILCKLGYNVENGVSCCQQVSYNEHTIATNQYNCCSVSVHLSTS